MGEIVFPAMWVVGANMDSAAGVRRRGFVLLSLKQKEGNYVETGCTPRGKRSGMRLA
jgi:hypothetical protein